MTDQLLTTKLKQAIEAFELEVDERVSIAESESRDVWKTNVNASFDRMRELVERHRQDIHSKVFTEIASQELSERDEMHQLRHSDERIAELMDVVKAHLATFAIGETDDGVGPSLEDQVLELRTVSHELAACVYAQEEVVASWFTESFNPGA